jgi:hypothetical protein
MRYVNFFRIFALHSISLKAFAYTLQLPIQKNFNSYHRNHRSLLWSSSESSDDTPLSRYQGKDVYQRIFYRFSPGSDVSIRDAMVVEERGRYTVDPQRLEYILPVGPRTLLLRNGRVDDGEIGDDFFSLSTSLDGTNVQSALVCALYLAANPQLCQGRLLELSAGDTGGLASLLGSIGAGYSIRWNSLDRSKPPPPSNDTEDDDILTISKGPSIFPLNFASLTISDVDESRLTQALTMLQSASSSFSRHVVLDVLDWRTRTIRPRGPRSVPEFRTIVASDVSLSYPESKELARTVANRLEASASYIYQTGSTLPQFVYVCPEDRDEVTYLRRILEKGYRMTTGSQYLKLEKLVFHLQTLPAGTPEAALDDEVLELKEFKEIPYQSLWAQHHPDYAGGGSGELFFPMETGEYDATGGSTFLEKEAGSSPW